MKKVVVIGVGVAVLFSLGARLYSPMAPESSRAPESGPDQLVAPPQPEPRPTLMLSLDDPAGMLYGDIGHEARIADVEENRIPIMQEPPVVKPTPTLGLAGTLSRFGISVDEKRRPIVHYNFAKSSAKNAAGAQSAAEKDRKE